MGLDAKIEADKEKTDMKAIENKAEAGRTIKKTCFKAFIQQFYTTIYMNQVV